MTRLTEMCSIVAGFGRGLGLETIVDAAGNLIVRKPATAGLENLPGVILQAHLDMVPQKAADKVHGFRTDPIEAFVADGWVHADGTTLGADDGIGVALIMALLGDNDLVYPMLEAYLPPMRKTVSAALTPWPTMCFRGGISSMWTMKWKASF